MMGALFVFLMMAAAFLHTPGYVWSTMAVLAAVFSRILVSTFDLPAAVNFVHFPLALLGACIAFASGSSRSSISRWMEYGILSLLGISLLLIYFLLM